MEQKRIGLGSNPLRSLFGGAGAPTPKPEPQPAAPPAPAPAVTAAPAPAPVRIEPARLEALPPAPAPTSSGVGSGVREGAPKAAPAPRSKRRTPRMIGDACTLHPGESKRTERLAVWLTPEEMEDLELLSIAEGLTESTLGRSAVAAFLEKHRDLIDQARIFREAIAKESA